MRSTLSQFSTQGCSVFEDRFADLSEPRLAYMRQQPMSKNNFAALSIKKRYLFSCTVISVYDNCICSQKTSVLLAICFEQECNCSDWFPKFLAFHQGCPCKESVLILRSTQKCMAETLDNACSTIKQKAISSSLESHACDRAYLPIAPV